MDREQLEERALRHLPGADSVQVFELMRGDQPFKLIARKGDRTEWQPFRAESDGLFLACKIVAGKLEIGWRA